MWLKTRLKNEYYAKMDFPREKVFIAHALLKNKVGKMRLFLQTLSWLCKLKNIYNSFKLLSQVYVT